MLDPKPTPDEAFKVLTKRVGMTLRSLGFQGSGQNYRRERGVFWQAINLQKSQWRVSREVLICFYTNIGFHFPKLEFKRMEPPPATLAKLVATRADLCIRVENLVPEDCFREFASHGIDGWNGDEVCETFERMLTEHLVPLLNAIDSREALARLLRKMPWMMTLRVAHYLGPELTPPSWDHVERDAGKWKKDDQGLWWGPGEW